MIDELREHAEELGGGEHLKELSSLIEQGTGARRQLEWLRAHGGDATALVREIVNATAP